MRPHPTALPSSTGDDALASAPSCTHTRKAWILRPLLLAFLATFASIAVAQDCGNVTFGGGSGTQADPYLLETPDHFVSLSDYFASGPASVWPACSEASFRMVDDVDLAGVTWSPLGQAFPGFGGTFDGDGHTVRNFSLDTTQMFTGFFATVKKEATIRDVRFVDATVSASDASAVVAASLSGTLENVHVSGGDVMVADYRAGGLVSEVYGGTLRNVSYRGSVQNANDVASARVGGIASGVFVDPGDASRIPTISEVFVDADVTGTGSVGGVVGTLVDGTIEGVRIGGGTIASTSESAPDGVGGVIGVADPASLSIVRDVDVAATIQGYRGVGGVVGFAWAGSPLQASDLSVRGTIEGEQEVGGIAGKVAGGTIHDVYVSATIIANDDAGGVAGWVFDGDLARIVARVSVRGTDPQDGSIGGLVGYVMDAFEIVDATVAGTVEGARIMGGIAGRADDGASFERVVSTAYVEGSGPWVAGGTGYQYGATYHDAFVDEVVSGQSALAGFYGPPEGLVASSTDALQAFETFRSRGWAIATGDPAIRGASDAVWRACAGAYPTLVGLGPSVDCAPADTGLTFGFEGASGEILRNVPFDVTVTLEDAAGPVTDALLDSTITLSATGGEVPVRLFVAGEDPDALPTATLPAGASSVTFENVVATGLSAEAGGDVRLLATGTAGTADGVTAQAGPASVRDVVMEVTASPTSIRADGVEASTIRVRFAEVAGDVPVADATMTFDTDLGTFTDGGAPVGTTFVAQTDADGVATARLVADGAAGTATVTVRCPGACPKSVEVELIGDGPTLRAVPGNGEAWIYVEGLGDDVVNLAVDRGEGEGFTALEPASTRSPIRLDDLTNGTEYAVRIQALTDGGSLPPTDPVTVTPGPVAVAGDPFGAGGGDAVAGAAERRPDGRVAVPVTVTLRNDTDVPWTDAWIAAPEVGNAWRIDAARIEAGRIVRDGDRWNLRFEGTPLAPGAEATVTLTLVEREP